MVSQEAKGFTIKIATVFFLSVVIANLHFMTPVRFPHFHLLYDRLCYIPILLGAFWFGFRGGIFTAIGLVCIHLFHIETQWGGYFFSYNLNQTLEVVMYLIIGVVTGALSERSIQTARHLSLSYDKLREKTDEVLKAEEQLRRTERIQALAELSAGIAHEIRTPLSSIKGAAEILASPNLTAERREEFTQILIEESKHLNRVVSEFLDFARPKTSEPICCRLEDVIDGVLDLIQLQCQQHDIHLIRNYEPNLRTVLFDPGQLKQVFANVITNAIQVMPNGGTLTVACRNNGNTTVVCTVEDTGEGIGEKNLLRIFDPFYTSRPQGTGLGLSIVQKILKHHHCTIEAANRPEGGACFTLHFPIEEQCP